ncbi:MAG: hypothetical protein M4579_002218 [Chaenotheca gracillima]|nr:MAG: hypothetical protein M4579_002218 [Chaenotheca gracillima]
MVLQTRSPSSHNEMIGRLIKHPPSTKYDDIDGPPPSKKLKRFTSLEDEEEGGASQASAFKERVIPDSEDDEDVDEPRPQNRVRQTDLESALPPVKSDKEAIEEYEASRSAERIELDLQGRLGQRQWTRGKNSIYVDAFNLALETVLEDEGNLFDEPEMAVFNSWRNLDYEAQYLYVRLFLRKTSTWHRIERLGYYSDIADLPAAAKELQESRNLPSSSATEQSNPGELNPPEEMDLGSAFTFADGSDDQITTLEEASTLLNLEELKSLAKDAKVQGKTKSELLRALRLTSKKQGGLGWAKLKRTESEETTVSTGTLDHQDQNDSDAATQHRADGLETNRDAHFVRKILSNTGPCIRLSLAPLKLFERVHLVFYRSTEWTEKSLTTIILARISRRNFPNYIVSRSTNIFTSRPLLLEFEAAIRTQFRIDNVLEFNGTPSKAGLQNVLDTFEEVYPRWLTLVKEEQLKEERVYESGEGAYLRRFSPAWFAYLFYDVLFLYIPNVFQTPYQTCPLDLHTDAFYPSRASEIHHRLVEIANGGAERLIKDVHARESEDKTCVVGLDWSFELDDLLEIVSCFDPEAIATICKVMAQEYRERGGGIPDLFLWHPTREEVLFAEVKSENDRLSDTQRLWIHVLTGAGVKVELCNAVAKEVRQVSS